MQEDGKSMKVPCILALQDVGICRILIKELKKHV